MFDPTTITRPHPILLRYYAIVSIAGGPLYPFVFLPLLCKYYTLRYTFDESGVSMSWGVLFRREIFLTYRRIQDIHLTRNLVQRWLGLASIAVQTASGSAAAELTIEGILDPEQLRDYLYSQMRGAESPASGGEQEVAKSDEALTLLRDIRDLLKSRLDRVSRQDDPGDAR